MDLVLLVQGEIAPTQQLTVVHRACEHLQLLLLLLRMLMMPVSMVVLMRTASTTMKKCSEMRRTEIAGLVPVRQDRQRAAVGTGYER